MKYADLIHKAWELTIHQPKLKWFAFIPSFIAVLVFAVEIAWQLFMYLDEWGYIEIDFIGVVVQVGGFILDSGLVAWIIFLALLVLFFVYILPAWVEGVLIFSVKHSIDNPEQPLHLRQRMVQGFDVYFRIFELRALFGLFSPWTTLLFTLTLYRYYHDTLFTVMWPFLLIFFIFTVVVTLFTHFAEHFIVFKNLKVMESLRQSMTLVFLNIGSVTAVFLIMVLVSLRVFLNVVMVIGVPLALIWAFTYFSHAFVLVIAIIVAIILLALTSYLTAILEVFSTAVWTETYLKFRAQQDFLEGKAQEPAEA